MALTDTEQRRILEAANRIMGMMVQRYDAKGNPARVIDSEDGDYLRQLLVASAEKLGVDVANIRTQMDEQRAAISDLVDGIKQAVTGTNPEQIRAAINDVLATSSIVAKAGA